MNYDGKCLFRFELITFYFFRTFFSSIPLLPYCVQLFMIYLAISPNISCTSRHSRVISRVRSQLTRVRAASYLARAQPFILSVIYSVSSFPPMCRDTFFNSRYRVTSRASTSPSRDIHAFVKLNK